MQAQALALALAQVLAQAVAQVLLLESAQLQGAGQARAMAPVQGLHRTPVERQV